MPAHEIFWFHSAQDALMNAMNDELPRIQEQVYYGHINSHTDILDKFLSESSISRYNPQVSRSRISLLDYCFPHYLIIVFQLVLYNLYLADIDIQIVAEGKAKPRFISLSSSILEEESVINDISYLHSPDSKQNYF